MGSVLSDLNKFCLVALLVLMAARLDAAEPSRPPAPLFDDIGSHHAEISTQVETAQQYFDQGLTLTYGFNHAEAVRSFKAAQSADPTCAMCYWGEAFALGPNINKPMDDADVPQAYAAAQKALSLAGNASPREQAYINALVARYARQPVSDRRPLDQAFADAMAEVAKAYPDDLDAASLTAEAMMDLMPWDYYTSDGVAKPLTNTVTALLESILAKNPDHPGAIHLYIHAVEASDTPERAEAGADRLGELVPGVGHLVHMPSHIYLRVGRYHDATLVNQRAAEADESYINQCRAQGFYPALYYPHNLHFLWYTASLEGRSEIAIPAGRKLADNVPQDLIAGIPLLEQFLAVPMYGLVRFGRWDEVLAEPKPRAKHAFATAMWHATRGMAQAHKGHRHAAAMSRKAFQDAAAVYGPGSAATQGYPADLLLRIAGHVLNSAIAAELGNDQEIIDELEAAVAIEDQLPYMEPPYWFFPNRHLLGSALLKLGRASEAEAVYRADLKHVPDNGWSLHGLAASLKAQGKHDEAGKVREQLAVAWERADIVVGANGVRYF